MNIGFNLPGPFRVGVSSSGRVTGGVTLGPVSMSGQIAGPAPTPRIPVQRGTLAEALEYATEKQGCTIVALTEYAATVQRGWWAWHIRQVQGGVQIQPIWSTRLTLTVVSVGALLFTALMVWAALAS